MSKPQDLAGWSHHVTETGPTLHDENPYSPAAPANDDVESPELPPPKPEYFGSVSDVHGEIDQAEALRLAKECVPIPANPTQAVKPKLNNTVIIGIIVVSAAFGLMLPGSESANGNGTPPPPLDTLDWLLFLLGIVVPIAFVLGIIVIAIANQRRTKDQSLPIWGRPSVRLTRNWVSISNQNREGALVESCYAWRQSTVQRSEAAWLILGGGAQRILVPRGWVESTSAQQEIDAFSHQLARWHALPGEEREKEARSAAAIYPPLPDDAIRFDHRVTEGFDPQTRREFAAQVRQAIPGAKPRLTPTSYAWAWSLTGGLLLFSGWAHPAYKLFRGEFTMIYLVIAILPTLLAIFCYWAGQSFSKRVDVTCALTEQDLWFLHDLTRVRFPLSNFSDRLVTDQGIALGNEGSESVVVIPRAGLEDPTAWDRAVALVETTPTAAVPVD